MSLSKLATDLGNIAKLDDEPNDVGGMTAAALKAKFDAAGNAIKTYLNDTLTPEADARADAHETRTDNPHSVTKAQVGLGNCDNTADADKPVSTAQKAYVDGEVLDVILGQIPDSSITSAKLATDVNTKLDAVKGKADAAHKATHAIGGSDALSPSDIGASTSFKATGTLTTAGWTGTAAPYTQNLTVAGVLETDRPRVDPVLGTDSAARDLIKTAWQLATASSNPPYAYDGKISFYAASKPTTNIPVVVSVVRP